MEAGWVEKISGTKKTAPEDGHGLKVGTSLLAES